MKHCGRKLRNMESTVLTFLCDLCDECSIVWRMIDDVDCVREQDELWWYWSRG